MELQGEQTLALPREQVWEALNDPQVLKQCLPGCDLFEGDGENRYTVRMTASVGPVRASFTGKLVLDDIQPPTSYSLKFEGSGGAAGFGKGHARVSLAEVQSGLPSAGTKLQYSANAQVGGRLAQVGARLIDGVAKKMSAEFFSRFARALGSGICDEQAVSVPVTPASGATAGIAAGVANPVMVPPQRSGSNPLNAVWAVISTLAAAVAVLAAAVAVHVAH
jgi:carbon monoxide dehydrogenase subunit G